ncbi:type IV pilus twitching motility protein PilT [Shewanella sp. YLB-07]|uniref:type IV pilus twitching motility protein PilT n=1 Tax=Shewanella sp. YLB-07 TaxID=2601268 RepID=UPI00128AE24C|nr:PilT/PilU family type 4a pilus ATPase [Shewanella sp. YLB-07]MPY22324.1 PilT/PilU family type 4a pilus ATPase [Shewanella sp. YLB-07]
MKNINEIILLSIKSKYSDIHLSTKEKIHVRKKGSIFEISDFTVNDDLIIEFIRETCQETGFNFTEDINYAYRFNEDTMLRVNFFRHNLGLGLVIRILNQSIIDLGCYDNGEVLKRISDHKKGLILLAGSTNSGKSTTLSSMVDYINKRKNIHILTIEEPIETVFKREKSIINQREVGTHVASFEDAIYSALREDVDVIVVGEIRNRETLRASLLAAETGHLVIATIHTYSSLKTIDRIINFFSGDEQPLVRDILSETLTSIISQELTLDKDGNIIPIQEIIINNKAVSNLIRTNKSLQIPSIIQLDNSLGMITRKDHIKRLIKKGILPSSYN